MLFLSSKQWAGTLTDYTLHFPQDVSLTFPLKGETDRGEKKLPAEVSKIGANKKIYIYSCKKICYVA